MDELHQAAAVARNDDRALVPQAIPKECLAIVRISGSVNERGTQRDHWQAAATVHPEQQALGIGFVSDIDVGVILSRQSVAFLMIQAVAVGGNARHINIAGQVVAACLDRGLNLGGRGAAIPVIDVVEDDVKLPARQGRAHGGPIVAVGCDRGHVPP